MVIWPFFAWWLFGCIASGSWTLYWNWHFDHYLSWGGVTFILLFGLGGPIAWIGLGLNGIAAFIIWLCERRFWRRPVFR